MRELVAAGRMQLVIGNVVGLEAQDGTQVQAQIHTAEGREELKMAEHVLAFFGLHPKLGPIADWGLLLERKALIVDPEKYQTSVPGIFAIGDINHYPGKKKLILSGFHEAALAAFAIQHHLFPDKRQFLQYTTTSPIMQKRLGVT
jgi:thioredoxin reductase (NADPH)